MFYEKISLMTNFSSDARVIYENLKTLLLEKYSDMITVETGGNSLGITIKDTANKKILDLATNTIATAVTDSSMHTLTVFRSVGDVNTLQTTDINHKDDYGSSYYKYNVPTELIVINNTTFAITLSPINNAANPGFKKPGIIVVTKTVKGNIAVIQPSYMLGIGKNTDDNPNGLSCLTRASTGESYAFSSILYESDLAYKTVISPVMVNGDSDYCKDVFWVPMIQFNVERGDDAILEIAGEYYYYNGFLACKIGK